MPGAFKSLPKVRDRVAELRAETRGQLVRDGERYSMNRIAHPLLFRDAFSKFGQPRRLLGRRSHRLFGIRNRNSTCSAVDKRPAQKEP